MNKPFKALADQTRLKLFIIIANNPNICLCDLESLFSLSISTLSRHLKELCQAELIIDNKNGKWKHYSVTRLGNEFINLILKNSNTEYLNSIKSPERFSKC